MISPIAFTFNGFGHKKYETKLGTGIEFAMSKSSLTRALSSKQEGLLAQIRTNIPAFNFEIKEPHFIVYVKHYVCYIWGVVGFRGVN
jgi:hypothetical protein